MGLEGQTGTEKRESEINHLNSKQKKEKNKISLFSILPRLSPFCHMEHCPSPVLEWVQRVMLGNDESHNFDHIKRVTEKSIEIAIKEGINDPRLLSKIAIVAVLHDAADHKYQNATIDDVRDCLRQNLPSSESSEQIQGIINIIECISFSKEKKNGLPDLGEENNLVRNIVSDADKLDALGIQGLRRCITYSAHQGGRFPDEVLKHLDEKLDLLPQFYIRTPTGKKQSEEHLFYHREFRKDPEGFVQKYGILVPSSFSES